MLAAGLYGVNKRSLRRPVGVDQALQPEESEWQAAGIIDGWGQRRGSSHTVIWYAILPAVTA